jgi:LuxR family maltose regulon positive regulatory protein
MAAAILTTKLYVPPVRAKLVSRSRLIQRLNGGLDRRLTLVSASAGFGKTTLLSEWSQSCKRPIAWVSLDEGDNDLLHFLSYVVGALQTVHAELGEAVLAAFQSPQAPPVESLLTALINEIAEVPDPFVLVLDDYHAITAPPIHQIVAFLLEHTPPQVHLVIASRSDPPLPLSRLRGRNQLSELREADLRFTTEEAATFLNQVMELSLSAENIAALDARTEGWITGLQMAALSMQELDDVSGFIAAFGGSHRYILDYLVEEVLQRQPEEIQAFLLHTSILERLCGPLCDAVAEIGDWRLETDQEQSPVSSRRSQDILEYLESSNLFIIPLDDKRRWYRYHHLFADLLRVRLTQAHPERLPELHRRASKWYEQNGLEPEAIDHALAAEDFASAVRLLVDNAWAMLSRGEMPTLLGWLDALPDEIVTTWPWMIIYRGWALALSGQLDAIEPHLEHTEETLRALPLHSGVDESDIDSMWGSVSAVRAWAARLQGDIPTSIELSNQALERLPEGRKTWRLRAVVDLNLGLTYWLSGDAATMAEALTRATQTSQTAGDIHLAMVALSILGQAYEMQGKLHQAADTYRHVLQMADEQGARKAPFVGLAHIGLAGPLLEWNDPDSAMKHGQEAIELGKRGGSLDTLQGAYQTMSMVLQAQGDITAALESVNRARELARRYGLTQMAVQLDPFEIRLRLAQGDVAAASRWADESGLSADDEFDFSQRNLYTTLARVLVARDQNEEALGLLARLQEADRAGGRIDHLIRLLVLQALALQAQDKIDRALSTLEEALALAEPEGYVRTFVREGEQMRLLLKEAKKRAVCPDYVSSLLDAFRAGGRRRIDAKVGFLTSTLLEPLSERELEVLHLIADGLSNQGIADRLLIATSTVKSHVNHILGKLNAKSRTQAAARARELGLL